LFREYKNLKYLSIIAFYQKKMLHDKLASLYNKEYAMNIEENGIRE